MLARALEHPLEQAAQLLARTCERLLAGRVAHQDVLQHAVACLELERPFEKVPERGPPVGLEGGGLGDRDELADASLEDRLDERLARREMPVERADPDSGATSDLLERGLDPVLGERLADARSRPSSPR